MPYKVEPTQRIIRLQRSLEAKQRAVSLLEQERAELHLKHLLLLSTCEVLCVFRQRKAALAGASVEQNSDLATDGELQHLNLLQPLHSSITPAAEDSPKSTASLQTQLLHTLSYSSTGSTADLNLNNLQRSNSSFSTSDGSWCLERDLNSTIAPSDDPLQFLRGLTLSPPLEYGVGCGLFGQIPVPHPAAITLEELQSYYYNSMNQLATHVTYLEQAQELMNLTGSSSSGEGNAALPQEALQHAEAAKQILFRYLQLINDMVLHHNLHILVPFYVQSVVTGGALEHKTDMYVQSLQQMDLSQQQRDSMVACFDFFVGLYGPVTSERVKMQQQEQQEQQEQQQAACSSKEGKNGAVSSDAEDGVDKSPFEVQRSVQKQQQQSWEEQQQRQQFLQTMDINMGKELMIIHLAAFTFWGSLTWLQAAKLVITCYPFPANPVVLVSVIEDLMQQQGSAGQQEQQRKQPPQQKKGWSGCQKKGRR